MKIARSTFSSFKVSKGGSILKLARPTLYDETNRIRIEVSTYIVLRAFLRVWSTGGSKTIATTIMDHDDRRPTTDDGNENNNNDDSFTTTITEYYL